MVECRVLFVADCQNLYYGSREDSDDERRVSFGRLRSWICKRYPLKYVRSLAFVALSPGIVERLVTYLERTGFEVVWRTSRQCRDGSISNTDVDARASMEIVNRIDTFDVLVMASGDSDFMAVLEYCKKKGKRVEIVCFRNSFSKDLLQVVDSVTFLSEEVTYRQHS